MSYAMERMRAAGADIGDYVEIKRKDGVFKGILMPHHEFSADNIVIIKLDNGYNIGVMVDEDCEIRVVERGREVRAFEDVKLAQENGAVVLISTGGTIASYVDYRTGAVHPAVTAEQLASALSDISADASVRPIALYSELSENIGIEHWQRLAKVVADSLNKGAPGAVIAHGTDTMAYTGAALSFMLGALRGPVVLVGAQRSSDRPSSDAYTNLFSALRIANSDLGEVVVVMHDSISDDRCAVHRAVRVRKMHTSRRDAFKSINSQPLGYVDCSTGEVMLSGNYRKKGNDRIRVRERMDERVSLIYFHPTLSPELLEYVFEHAHGVVLMGTGLGHVADRLIGVIEKGIKDGVHVVMTSQCIYGTVNMRVYSTGRNLLKAGVIPGEDMLPEVAYVKLMWALGNFEHEDVPKVMRENLVGEIGRGRGVS
ncbi:MAG: Glu-tRNA(Gln) amidotransferase GatDE subunit D [Thermoplasmata archaeon]|nr:MAG: Glu-tRNA(Gln) amidotransferase GatDE subunit D [Thermoplasmata archaeon]